MPAKQQGAFRQSVFRGIAQMPVEGHLLIDAFRSVKAQRQDDFRLVIDAVAFKMPKAHQRRFGGSEEFVK